MYYLLACAKGSNNQIWVFLDMAEVHCGHLKDPNDAFYWAQHSFIAYHIKKKNQLFQTAREVYFYVWIQIFSNVYSSLWIVQRSCKVIDMLSDPEVSALLAEHWTLMLTVPNFKITQRHVRSPDYSYMHIYTRLSTVLNCLNWNFGVRYIFPASEFAEAMLDKWSFSTRE